jgi:hypothetical protein
MKRRVFTYPLDYQKAFLEDACNHVEMSHITEGDISDVNNIHIKTPIPFKASVLMAPCFHPPGTIEWSSNISLRPNPELMRYMIGITPILPALLPRTTLISFNKDNIAYQDVEWLKEYLHNRLINCTPIKPDWWVAFPHFTPILDPIQSGLSECVIKDIDRLNRH